MQKTIEVVFERGVFKPLEPVDLKEGEKMDIRIEDEKTVIRKVETSLREYNDFLPRNFNFTLEKLRTDSRDRFKRFGIIP
jgi:predicted DNA-binding antitoxin AbrB/MazE fold protein